MKIIKYLVVILLLASYCNVFSQKRYDDRYTKHQSDLRQYDSMLLIVRTAKADSIKANTLNSLSQWARLKSRMYGQDYEPTIEYVRLALEIARKINNKAEMANAFSVMGDMAAEKGNYSEALETFFRTIKIAEEVNDKKCIRQQHLNIGNVYITVGNYTDALKHHLTALRMYQTMGERGWRLFFSYRYTGVAYHKTGNYNEALKCFFAGYKEADSFKVNNAKGIFYRYIGNVYKDMGNYDSALTYHLNALKNTTERADPIPLHLALHNTDIGILYNNIAAKSNPQEARKMYEQALTYLTKGLDFAKKINSKTVIMDANSALAEAYNGIEDYKNALYFTRQYLPLKDSLFNSETFKKVSELKVQHEMEKEQLKEKGKQQLALAEEKALRERLLGEQMLQQEKKLAEEIALNKLNITEQKFLQEKETAKERANYDKAIMLEKVKQEKLKVEKQRMNTISIIVIIGISMISALLFLLFRQRHLKRRAVEKAQALHKMAELELHSLRAQLNPHFMFNSLNSIQELILLENNEKSSTYLSAFSDLLRMLLDNANQPFISLRKELDFLEIYLSLENLRITNLEYAINIQPGFNITDVKIPNMILQPYIENAIWHGLSHKKSNKKLQINVSQNGNNIVIGIIDNGIGRQKAAELKSRYRKQHKSKGMELLSDRFHLLSKEYGTEINATVTDLYENQNPVGTRVEIIIPLLLSEKLLQAS